MANMTKGDGPARRGKDLPDGSSSKISVKEAAEVMDVGERSVHRAKKVMTENPEAHEAPAGAGASATAAKRGEEPPPREPPKIPIKIPQRGWTAVGVNEENSSNELFMSQEEITPHPRVDTSLGVSTAREEITMDGPFDPSIRAVTI